jgi:hypothetical protein
MFMLMQCTAWSKRSAVEDKDGRSRNCQMDDIMLKCKLHGDDIVVLHKCC